MNLGTGFIVCNYASVKRSLSDMNKIKVPILCIKSKGDMKPRVMYWFNVVLQSLWWLQQLQDKRKSRIIKRPTSWKYTHAHTHTPPPPYLLNIPVEAEEVEDAGAVHLGWMEATHHGNRAGCVARVWGWGLGQRVGNHVRNVHWGELVPAVSRQRQQGAGWTWRGTQSHFTSVQ